MIDDEKLGQTCGPRIEDIPISWFRTRLDSFGAWPNEQARLTLRGMSEWLASRGFVSAARVLGESSLDPKVELEGLGPEALLVVSSLRGLFGESRRLVRVPDRYDLVCGADRSVNAGPAETWNLEIDCLMWMRLRRIAISASDVPGHSMLDRITVRQVLVGVRRMFGNLDAVDGAMFSPDAPEFMNEALFPNSRITITIENLSESTLIVNACALGDRLPEAYLKDTVEQPAGAFAIGAAGAGERWRISLLERVEKLLGSDPGEHHEIMKANLLDEIGCERRSRREG